MGYILNLPERKSLKSLRGGKRVKGRPLIPAKKSSMDGFSFDSETEMEYYRQVLRPKLLKCDIYQHPIVNLVPGINWKLDFLVIQRGDMLLIDVKGMRISREASLKISLWASFGPHELRITKRDPHSGIFLNSEIIPPGTFEIENFVPSVQHRGKKM